MNSVGIDVSKGKNMIAVMRPFGEVVISPYEVRYTDSKLNALLEALKNLGGEIRVVMEATGNYHLPIVRLLHDAGIYVSVVNAMLVHDYGNNSLRSAKTDRKDAVKIANYDLNHWPMLPQYFPVEETRLLLKNCYRQYQQYSKGQTMLKNNLISLLDTAFPAANRLFYSPARSDGGENGWISSMISGIASASAKSLRKPLQPDTRSDAKSMIQIQRKKALDIYANACENIGVMPKTNTTKLLIEQAVSQLWVTFVALTALRQEMQTLASSLPKTPL